jgi:hypothetical protein
VTRINHRLLLLPIPPSQRTTTKKFIVDKLSTLMRVLVLLMLVLLMLV